MSSHPDLPADLSYLHEYAWKAITIGKSGAAVWHLEGSSGALVLKTARVHRLSELPGEASRLRWLETVPVAAPRVRAFLEANGQYWLLMSALPGRDLTHLVGRPQEVVTILARALRHLHGLNPVRCPFDHSLGERLLAGAANLQAGLVDESDFDDARNGWSGDDVLAWLHEHRPDREDLVVTHGDASLPNVMAFAGQWSGIVDCSRVGLADRWQDLAIACRSIIFNCGEHYVPVFLEAYGADWDETRYRYYCTLDELF